MAVDNNKPNELCTCAVRQSVSTWQEKAQLFKLLKQLHTEAGYLACLVKLITMFDLKQNKLISVCF